MNHKKLFRLYREEGLAVRRRRFRKRALGTRRPILVPDRANQRWSLDFVSDAFEDGQRFRVLCIVDDCTREALAAVVDRSLSGARMTRELDDLNRIPQPMREKIKDLALKESDLSPRELAVQFTDTEKYFVSEASVYRILKSYDLITSPAYVVLSAADEFRDKTTQPNQLWQTDFTYLKVIGWGWFYLSTILDDYSRYIIAWKLCTTMKASDVTDTLDLALQASGCAQATVFHKPRLLSDNGSSYISGELAEWLEDQEIDHVQGAPYHPQTQGKIERWHQNLKNRILLENYYLPGDLRQQIDAFVNYYNHRRYHESLQNLTPADVYFERGHTILKQRERIKRKTIETRRLLHRKSAA